MNLTVRASDATGRPKHFTVAEEQMAARVTAMAVGMPPSFNAIKSVAVAMPSNSTTVERYKKWMEVRSGICIRLGGTPTGVILSLLEHRPDAIVGGAGFLRAIGLLLETYHPKLVLSSGTRFPPHVASELRAIYPNSQVYSCYAASEVGMISWCSAAEAEAVEGFVGKPCPGVTVRIDAIPDAGSARLASKLPEGQIAARAPGMISAYDDPDDTGKRFKDGWFLTGDRGSLTERGELILSGRLLERY